jgi:hypothetical protein
LSLIRLGTPATIRYRKAKNDHGQLLEFEMDIEEQKGTYDGFIKYTVRSTVAIIVVMALLAIFVA